MDLEESMKFIGFMHDVSRQVRNAWEDPFSLRLNSLRPEFPKETVDAQEMNISPEQYRVLYEMRVVVCVERQLEKAEGADSVRTANAVCEALTGSRLAKLRGRIEKDAKLVAPMVGDPNKLIEQTFDRFAFLSNYTEATTVPELGDAVDDMFDRAIKAAELDDIAGALVEKSKSGEFVAYLYSAGLVQDEYEQLQEYKEELSAKIDGEMEVFTAKLAELVGIDKTKDVLAEFVSQYEHIERDLHHEQDKRERRFFRKDVVSPLETELLKKEQNAWDVWTAACEVAPTIKAALPDTLPHSQVHLSHYFRVYKEAQSKEYPQRGEIKETTAKLREAKEALCERPSFIDKDAWLGVVQALTDYKSMGLDALQASTKIDLIVNNEILRLRAEARGLRLGANSKEFCKAIEALETIEMAELMSKTFANKTLAPQNLGNKPQL